MIGKKRGKTYDVVAAYAVVYDIVGQTYDIVYDIVGNIVHTIGKKRSKTYDIVGFSFDIVAFFQYRRF
jgi:hypothetical protein